MNEKLVVILLIIAILLSVVSIAVTMVSLNSKQVPGVSIINGGTEDNVQGRVSIIINSPSGEK